MRLSGTKLSSISQSGGLGNQLWDLSGTRPSLDLPFSDTKSLVDTTTGKTLVDHTRASSGTYVGSDGLIKTATTNLLLRSEEFDQSYWIKQANTTVTPNQAVAPDGTFTADLAEGNGSDGLFSEQVSVSTSSNNTKSVWIRSVTGSATVQLKDAHQTVGTTTCSLTTSWQRFTLTETQLNGIARLWVTNIPASGIYIWGAQLEQSSTVGEYVKTTSTINSAPRFDHDPTTGESLGLLVEESRSNLLTYSEQLDNPTWGVTRILPFGSGSIANAAIAPDGTLTADKLVEDTSASTIHYFSQNFAAAATTNYTFSIFLKAAERSWVVFLIGGTTFGSHGVYVDLANGIAGTVVGTPISTKVDKYSNGWVRVSITQVSTVLGTGVLQVRTATGDGGQVYTGDGTSGIYAWGAQLEAGSFPTSYIPTEGSTVTRAADVASISGSNFSSWYRQDEGTVFAEHSWQTNSDYSTVWGVSDGTIDNEIRLIGWNNGADRAPTMLTDGVPQVSGTNRFYSGNTNYKYAIALKQDSVASCRNGDSPLVDSSATLPLVSTLSIGSTRDIAFYLNSRLKRLTYWPTRLPNDTLQTITT